MQICQLECEQKSSTTNDVIINDVCDVSKDDRVGDSDLLRLLQRISAGFSERGWRILHFGGFRSAQGKNYKLTNYREVPSSQITSWKVQFKVHCCKTREKHYSSDAKIVAIVDPRSLFRLTFVFKEYKTGPKMVDIRRWSLALAWLYLDTCCKLTAFKRS